PTSGSIQQADVSSANREDQFIRVIPQGPRPDMSQVQVVQGFLDASAASDADYAVARQFLTGEAAARWDAGSGVRVYKGATDLSVQDSTVQFTAPLAGEITSDGTYEINQTGRGLRATFSLVRENSQWRIADLPQGLELSSFDVQRAFRPLSVYYFNPQYSTLVPDSRMIPVPGSGLATGLMLALLSGPSSWLGPAVVDSFPLGVGLNFDSVPVENGVAKVDLTADAIFASDVVRRQMAQQIVWTLRQVPEVRSVGITAGGQILSIPGVPYPTPRDQWPEIDPSGLSPGTNAIVVNGSGVLQLSRTGSEQVAGSPKQLNATLTQVVANRSLGLLAGIDALGRVWTTPRENNAEWVRLPITRVVQWIECDPSGGLWIWDQVDGLAVWDAPGPLKTIRVQGLPPGGRLLRAVPSRDGTRAALVVRTGSVSSLYLARIEQDATTRDRVITGLRAQAPTVSGVLDVDWASANSLAFIGRFEGGGLQSFDLNLAQGNLSAQGGPDNPESIASAPGLPVLIGARAGVVYQLDAGTWSARINAWSPAYPS
ncbi:MAG: LpqB family beta-propeller domain-containing protein, partial [Candidatus Nanopelagicales bacterium]